MTTLGSAALVVLVAIVAALLTERITLHYGAPPLRRLAACATVAFGTLSVCIAAITLVTARA
ncbi:hypothetical protein GCM10023205_25390 [Yinghuangia aomiensis]|uniref:Uncharacterized protein n=1 Tax=Yinghuangia aomiensis TaxID=676205 RepID=A0ABP9H3F9_9ACTN